MTDGFDKKSCGECAKLRTEFCTRPDACVKSGYKYFQDPYTLPEKFCPICGARWKRPRSRRMSDNYRVIELECPNGCQKPDGSGVIKKFMHIEVRNTP